MFLPFSADRICCSCDRCALGTWFIGGKMTYWLERLDNLAVSQSSCFLRVTWQLRTERMLQLVYNEYLLLDVLDDLALADRCKQESIRNPPNNVVGHRTSTSFTEGHGITLRGMCIPSVN
ncbi:hypothetical protein T265_10704 [Opisthorchis viverrini]|uniref:Uncharacterized protein n=1 Tax=Opisthorchis viverrini TaxID=6198 RepID=A0A074ZC96_OPIVI|nr:hypothetical protein T265_10704 [Opisthorchis viverrini]KER20830.1 hypothetical protein T265_10704 [Opisthorchis viverrini]